MEEDRNSMEPHDYLASRRARLAAVMLDGVLAALFMFPVMLYWGVWDMIKNEEGIPWAITLLLAAFGFMLFLVLHGYLLKNYGQTIGKRVLGIRITTLDGKVPEFWPLIAKRYVPLWIVTYLPFVGTLFPTIDALFIFRKDKRCLHDLIAGTIVQNSSANKSPQPTPKSGATELKR